MRLLCEHNVPPRYLEALDGTEGLTVHSCTTYLPDDATDTEIAAYATSGGYVLLTRDEDFFELDPDCGVLFLDPNRSPRASRVREAVERVRAAYPTSEYDRIREPIPGAW